MESIEVKQGFTKDYIDLICKDILANGGMNLGSLTDQFDDEIEARGFDPEIIFNENNDILWIDEEDNVYATCSGETYPLTE